MNLLKVLVGAAAAGTIVMAFREEGRWLRPAIPAGDGGYDDDEGGLGRDDYGEEDFIPGEEEPVLGYDGMDRDTLVDWLRGAALDPGTLARIRRYESAHLARGPVLDAIDDLMG